MQKRAVVPVVLVALVVSHFPASGQEKPAESPRSELPLNLIKLPPGFTIDIYASGVRSARQMALGSKGTLFVGTRGKNSGGIVHAVVDKNGDQKADQVITVAKGLNDPNGVAFRDGSLYVAEINRIIRFDDIESKLDAPPEFAVVNDTLPKDTHHGQKFIAFGPDGLLYVPVGAPCNVCEREDPRYATIMRMKPDGSGLEVFASGVRNTVGFDWHPRTRELWFTDNGRDMLGDDVPTDELNTAPRKGMHFGFPYCHQGDVADSELGAKKPCTEFEKPARKLDAHVAAIGMRFYTGKMFPEEYRNQIIIAEHGSWNRSIPQGYRLSLVKLDGNKAVSYTRFAEGWLRGLKPAPAGSAMVGDVWGRPADVLVMPDGALLVSDDNAGVIYRISYKG
ncbi:MAG: PQQ-dependent sugar dehydrogenase [Vicinamibacterales bacterium]